MMDDKKNTVFVITDLNSLVNITTALADLVKWYLVERKTKPLDQHATKRSASRKVTDQGRAETQIMTIGPLATKQGPSFFALKKAIGSSTGQYLAAWRPSPSFSRTVAQPLSLLRRASAETSPYVADAPHHHQFHMDLFHHPESVGAAVASLH
jgi:hypothetical protein